MLLGTERLVARLRKRDHQREKVAPGNRLRNVVVVGLADWLFWPDPVAVEYSAAM